jgi:hypothetical protein
MQNLNNADCHKENPNLQKKPKNNLVEKREMKLTNIEKSLQIEEIEPKFLFRSRELWTPIGTFKATGD